MIHITCRADFLLLLLFLLLPGCRQVMAGDVMLYRCTVDGVVEFRQTACLKGGEGKIHIKDHSKGITPSAPGLRLKKVSEKSDAKPLSKNNGASEERCWKKRRQLERVERKLRAGYKPSQYERLHERQETYESYIRKFCR
ncbi:MAG: hypothetical protein KZQ93_01690 [Candidatus Thiodiazotropha sp. (ex Monitilora ramsayi)]|nr:hypothetical protein [Candidatus Thiodiazotropha sp. (ex Monitilora ramsayi)]